MADNATNRQPPSRPDEGVESTAEHVPAGAAENEAVIDAGGAIERLQSDLEEANNRTLRAQAELENFRKRIRREMEDQQRYASLPVLRDLLTVVDDMERAIAAAEKSQDSAGLLQGVKMVEARLRSVLDQHGCQKIEAEGSEFDPTYHEAILHQPSDQHEPGTVMQVTQQGYRLHDRVIRPAQVIVAKAPPES